MQKRSIVGCRFSLAVMSDDYINMILNSLKDVNTENVWSSTDALSTIYRGDRIHVLDALKACFVNINDGKTHITMEATLSNGYLCDNDTDVVFPENNQLLNDTNKNFTVHSKLSFYPLEISVYTDCIDHILVLAKQENLFIRLSYYAIELIGDINKLFNFYEKALFYANNNIACYVFQITLSVNSPTKEDLSHYGN